jgi:hypothetical protein
MSWRLFAVGLFFFTPFTVFAATSSLSTSPESVIQGEPILVTINGITGTSSVKKISFDSTTYKPFIYKNIVSALIGIDLHKKSGTYSLSAHCMMERIYKKILSYKRAHKSVRRSGSPRSSAAILQRASNTYLNARE